MKTCFFISLLQLQVTKSILAGFHSQGRDHITAVELQRYNKAFSQKNLRKTTAVY